MTFSEIVHFVANAMVVVLAQVLHMDQCLEKTCLDYKNQVFAVLYVVQYLYTIHYSANYPFDCCDNQQRMTVAVFDLRFALNTNHLTERIVETEES